MDPISGNALTIDTETSSESTEFPSIGSINKEETEENTIPLTIGFSAAADSSIIWRGFQWTNGPTMTLAPSISKGPFALEVYSMHLLSNTDTQSPAAPAEIDVIGSYSHTFETKAGPVSITPFTSVFNYIGVWRSPSTLEAGLAAEWTFFDNDGSTLAATTEQDIGLINQLGAYYGDIGIIAAGDSKAVGSQMSIKLGWGNQTHNNYYVGWQKSGLLAATFNWNTDFYLSNELTLSGYAAAHFEPQDILDDDNKLNLYGGISLSWEHDFTSRRSQTVE